MRNHLGKWIKGFSANFGIYTSVKTELLALLKGLQVGKAESIAQLIIQMDSQIVVDKINEPIGKRHAYGNIIKQCQLLMLDPDWTVQLTLCFRVSNKAADFLTNEGLKQTMPMLFHTNPPSRFFQFCLRIYWA